MRLAINSGKGQARKGKNPLAHTEVLLMGPREELLEVLKKYRRDYFVVRVIAYFRDREGKHVREVLV